MKYKTYFAFLRPFTLIPPALGMISGSLVAIKGITYSIKWIIFQIVLGAIIAIFLNGASNSINQIFDLEIDKINKPSRPLASKQISIKEAWIITILCYIIALSLSFIINIQCFIIVFVGAFFTVIYSVPPIRTKQNWITAAFTIAIPRGILLKVAGWSVLKDIKQAEPWYIGVIFGLFLLGATTTKDYADIKGDAQGHCTTLPIKFGIKQSIWMISPFFILPFLLIPIGVITGYLHGSPILLWLLGITLMIWGCYVVYLLIKDPDSLTKTENHPSWTQMYMMMMYAQIGFAVAYIL